MEPNNNQSTPQAPEIPESEMKLPEDQFGNQPMPEPAPSHSVNPLFIVALILLLTVLAVVIIWGEELVGMFLPESTVQLEPLPEPKQSEVTEADLEDIGREIDQTDVSSTTEEETSSIEAQMNAELSGETQI